jgi:hypothetical protein
MEMNNRFTFAQPRPVSFEKDIERILKKKSKFDYENKQKCAFEVVV